MTVPTEMRLFITLNAVFFKMKLPQQNFRAARKLRNMEQENGRKIIRTKE
jgi:hypothetical protein